ncbi:MAG TPA: glycosyltransferase family 39 protein [Kofleriaceae bacterium]|nr:glycosyltransferase family 39 protein [Kofleriaceae bacterium]
MTWTSERRLLVAALLAWAIVATINLVLGPPLGHDEAAFAVVARDDWPVWLYRSRGVVALARLGIALGGADWQLRLASTIAGLGVVLGVYAVGRAVFDARTGAWAAAVIATAHPMLLRNAQLLGDLPATAGVLAGIAVLVAELDRPAGPRWRIVLAAPAFAAAFYARYGTAPVIAIAVLAAAALWSRSIRARPLPVLAAAALFALLLVPHALHSLHWTGELLGVLRASAGQPRRAYLGEGLVTYLTANPFAYYGALVAPLMVAGLVGLARTFRRRAPWFLGGVALGQLVALGLASHAQPRYLFIAVALLVVLGVEAAGALARPRTALALIGAAWLAAAIALVASNLRIARTRSAILAATAAITADRQARPCMILAGLAPQLTWYSRCEGTRVDEMLPDALAPARARYLVSMPYAPLDGPAFAAAHGVTLRELPTGNERARVWAIQ